MVSIVCPLPSALILTIGPIRLCSIHSLTLPHNPLLSLSALSARAQLVAHIDELHRGLRLQYALASGLVGTVAPDGAFTFHRAVGAAKHQLGMFCCVLSCLHWKGEARDTQRMCV